MMSDVQKTESTHQSEIQWTAAKTPWPLSRYLLFLGAFMTIPLTFLPWITARISFYYPGFFGATTTLASYNPIQIYGKLLGIPPYPSMIYLVLIVGSCLPGPFFIVWLRGTIMFPKQCFGVVLYSIWVVLLTVINNYMIFGMLYEPFFFQRALWIVHVWFWQADIGLYVWVLTQLLLWITLVLLWREMPYTPKQYVYSIFHHSYTIRDVGMVLMTFGGIFWFIGYYGMYWYLPDGCFSTPLFGFALCINRLDTMIGFVSVIHRFVVPSFLFSQMIYWGLGIAVVLGGMILFAFSWIRQSVTFPLIWTIVWMGGILLLTGMSSIGIFHLVAIYPDERMTMGFPLTVLGILMMTSGLVIRWRFPISYIATIAPATSSIPMVRKQLPADIDSSTFDDSIFTDEELHQYGLPRRGQLPLSKWKMMVEAAKHHAVDPQYDDKGDIFF